MTPDPVYEHGVVTLYDPTSLPLSFLGLETLVIVLTGLTLAHALRAHREGDRAAVLTWLTIAIYGLAMEIVSYNFVDNFKHGQFTVMLYDRQLPLYITGVYPVLLYTGIMTARALRLAPSAEPFAAGVLIVAMDAPFDVVGPAAGWWVWLDGHPEIAVRWFDVPVTSYYWHFSFGTILAALTRIAATRSRRPRGPALWMSIPISVAVMTLGVIAFLPFHGLVALGIDDGVVVGAVLTLALARAATAPHIGQQRLDRWITALWLVFYGYHAVVATALTRDDPAGWAPRIGFIALVAAAALGVCFTDTLRRPVLRTPAA